MFFGNGISVRNRASDIPLLQPCYQENCRGHTTLVSYSENRGCEKEEEHTYSLRHTKCDVQGFIHELCLSKTPTSEVRLSEGF